MSSLKVPLKGVLFFSIILFEFIFYINFELLSTIFLVYIFLKLIFLSLLYLQKSVKRQIDNFEKEEKLLIRKQCLKHLPDRELYILLEFPED